MIPRRFLFGVLLVSLAAGSGLWAEEPTERTAEAATAEEATRETSAAGRETAAPGPACSPAGSLNGQPRFVNAALGDSEKTDTLGGCTANYACVHGGSVSCTGTNECISSGQGCGLVVCDGEATFCPGACNGNDWSCVRFCRENYDSEDGYCDLTRCCVCL